MKNYNIIAFAIFPLDLQLTVVATDRGDPNLSTSSTFVIRVLDENDNNPAFPRPDVSIF